MTAAVAAPAMPALDMSRLEEILAGISGGDYPGMTPELVDPDTISGTLSAIRDYAAIKKPQVQKAWTDTSAVTGDPTSKDFWDFLNSVVSTAGPLIVSAVTGQDVGGKAYQPDLSVAAAKRVVDALPPDVRQDKDFWTGLGGFLQNALPIVVGAIQGTSSKSFQPDTAAIQTLPKDFNWQPVVQTGLQILGPLLGALL
jgi:hypothetical protein